MTIKDGVVNDSKVTIQMIANIAHGPLEVVHAIVVHQTDSNTAASTIDGYKNGPKQVGAHFLIDKDGAIYQVVPITQKCWHVGKLRSKCLETHTCSSEEQKFYSGLQKTYKGKFSKFVAASDVHERQKIYPARFPDNSDAIGIEIVGKSLDPQGDNYDPLTDREETSLRWLVSGLLEALKLKQVDVYKHPQISRKGKGEAAGASL